MNVRKLALCFSVIAGVACSSYSSGPRESGDRGYALSGFGAMSPVPTVVTLNGRSVFHLGGSLLLSKDGQANGTFRYRLDSNGNPQQLKVFTGTWVQSGEGRTITLDGATGTETTIDGVSRVTMTATWTDAGMVIGGVFEFTRVLPE